VQYQLAEAQVYSSYSVALSDNPARAPKGWRLHGYDGARWELLDQQRVLSDSAGRNEVYPIANGGRFLRYHFVFEVDSGAAERFLEVKEITLKQESHEAKPVIELIAGGFVFSNFERAAVATRLFQELAASGDGYHTFFIPWNVGFEALPFWKKITMSGPWREHLRDLLLGHVALGEIPKSALVDGLQIPMLNGDTAVVSRASRPKLDGISFLGHSWAGDGYAHFLQSARAPVWSTRTILDVLRDSENSFARILEILGRPGMEDIAALLGDKSAGVTFFAPTDSAVTDELYACEGEQCAEMARVYLVNTVLARRYTPSAKLPTQSGRKLDWAAGEQTVSCTSRDGARRESALVGEEELAVNGVLQPIDAPLCRP
jgi:uncharacterized surface protein with fasciclin (FAS1) repeats